MQKSGWRCVLEQEPNPIVDWGFIAFATAVNPLDQRRSADEEADFA
jgi:hypothetical protein